jgi:hypothetical protein
VLEDDELTEDDFALEVAALLDVSELDVDELELIALLLETDDFVLEADDFELLDELLLEELFVAPQRLLGQ